MMMLLCLAPFEYLRFDNTSLWSGIKKKKALNFNLVYHKPLTSRTVITCKNVHIKKNLRHPILLKNLLTEPYRIQYTAMPGYTTAK